MVFTIGGPVLSPGASITISVAPYKWITTPANIKCPINRHLISEDVEWYQEFHFAESSQAKQALWGSITLEAVHVSRKSPDLGWG
ncbi:hypothetical protein TNCV_918361 [Trichonephila clavipes]|nr:hypothetical protein TNCV_918361 [Trichonephila clavipes]